MKPLNLRNIDNTVKERHLDTTEIDAETFSVVDSGTRFTATTIEAVLAEMYDDYQGYEDTLKNLTVNEITQLLNIDTTTISINQWGYLGLMDQGVASGDTVTFNSLSLTTPLADASVANDITLDNITQITSRSHTNLSDIGTNAHSVIDTHLGSTSNPHTVTKAQLGLDTTDDVVFNTVTLSSVTNGTHAATKDYVDGLVQGVDWQDSVLDIIDEASATQITGNRYIASANGSTWTKDNIYEWNGASWDETVTNEGFATWVEDEDIKYVYNGTSWVKFGSTITHNNLASILGSSEGYHFSATDYANRILTTSSVADLSDVTSAGSGSIISSTERTNYNSAYSHSTTTTGNPHSVNASDVGLGNVDNVANANQTTLGTVTSGDVTAIDSIGKITSKASGDVFYWTTSLQRLAKGTDGQALILSSGLPSWQDIQGMEVHDIDGSYHSVTNANVGHVLQITATDTFGFAQLDHTDLGTITSSDHHDPVTLGTANGLSLSTQQLSLGLASTSTTGALSSTDWNTFNGKQDSGNYLEDSDFGTNGLMRRTGAGTYDTITDSSSNWDSAYTHSTTTTGNPHSLDASDVGAEPADAAIVKSDENETISTFWTFGDNVEARFGAGAGGDGYIRHDSATAGKLDVQGDTRISFVIGTTEEGYVDSSGVHGPVYQADYADTWKADKGENIVAGKCYSLNDNGLLELCSKRNDKRYFGICTDTQSFIAGEGLGDVRIAVAGFPLAYVDKPYKSGTLLVPNKEGILTKKRFWERAVAMYMKKGKDGRCWVKILK